MIEVIVERIVLMNNTSLVPELINAFERICWIINLIVTYTVLVKKAIYRH